MRRKIQTLRDCFENDDYPRWRKQNPKYNLNPSLLNRYKSFYTYKQIFQKKAILAPDHHEDISTGPFQLTYPFFKIVNIKNILHQTLGTVIE